MTQELQELAARRAVAKKAEDAAAKMRKGIDAEIVEFLKTHGMAKAEGTVTEKLDDYKVVVEYSVNRKLNTAKLQNDWATLPHYLQGVVTWKAELSTTRFRDLDQHSLALLSEYMESKPASPTVKVEVNG